MELAIIMQDMCQMNIIHAALDFGGGSADLYAIHSVGLVSFASIDYLLSSKVGEGRGYARFSVYVWFSAVALLGAFLGVFYCRFLV